MCEKSKISEIADKIQGIKSSVDGMNFDDNKEIANTLNDIISCLSDMANEMIILKSEIEDSTKNFDELNDRVIGIEEYIEESELLEEDDGIIARIECPYCKAEVVIGEEFLTEEEPKVICESCKNEIEIITSGCDCGCEGEEDEEEDCECECGCGCGDDCEEDEGCAGDCTCGEKH